MSRFFEDALGVFETAASGCLENIGILVDPVGAIRIVRCDGWRPDTLAAHYGARDVFQVTHSPSGVRVDARSGSYSCTFARTGATPLLRGV